MENIEYNYPIRYAIMPYNEHVGYVLGTNKKIYDVTGYIASKCYVLSKKINYLEDGSSEKEYEVVFPYQKKELWKIEYPSRNSIIVTDLYDSFEDAVKAAK